MTDSDLDWTHLFAARAKKAGGDLTAILALAGSSETITFSGGFPAEEAFPVDLLRGVVDEILSSDPARALQYSPSEGLATARQAVADLVAASQRLRPDPSEVLITSGGIEALGLISKVLLEAGDRVAVEAPTYLGALTSFSGFAADLHPLPMDHDSLVVDQISSFLAAGHYKLAYVIPDHQNPTGLSMSLEQRRALVEACRRNGVLLVEDVAYRELGFAGRPAESLWSLGPDVVLQVGTFSKILFPGVRLGWALGPPEVLRAMAGAKQSSDQCAGSLGQAIMEGVVTGGGFRAHLDAVRGIYAGRAAAMLGALDRHMPDGVSWTRPSGGFFVWLTAREGTDTALVATEALRRGVAYVPGRPFYVDGRGARQMRLAYSGVTEPRIEEGISRLAPLLQQPGGKFL
ncbi:MAG: PLP-dependent aminotransferase family protein [Acidimicrobiales bacterium]